MTAESRASEGKTVHRTIGPVTTASALGAAVAHVLAWLIGELFTIVMPNTVEVALGIIITVVGAMIGGFLVPGKTGEHVATRN